MSNEIDTLMGLWHDFSEQSFQEIERQFTSYGRSLIKRVLKEAASGMADCEFQTDSEFAMYVVSLRENERAWSRYLGEMILRAQDELEKGDPLAAEKLFDHFEAACPWNIYTEIAVTHRNNLGKPPGRLRQ